MINMANEAIVEVSESPSEAYTPIGSNVGTSNENLRFAKQQTSPELRPTIFAQPPSLD